MAVSRLIRAFFAVEIGERLRRELAAAMGELQRVDAAVKWVEPKNLHWTVKFLGDVPMTSVGEIAAAAEEALAGHESFSGTVTGIGPFPDARKLRMVAARMDEGGQASPSRLRPGSKAGPPSMAPTEESRVVAPRGAKTGGRLANIRDDLELAMEDFGVPPDGHGFKAHLTMGRIKGSRGIRELAEALKGYDGRGFGECRVEEVVLFMSELSRAGPTYTALARVPLGA